MEYEAKHALKIKKSAARLARFQYMMAERIKKDDMKWNGREEKRLAKFQYMMAERVKKGDMMWKDREAAGKASSGFRAAVK